MLPMDGCTEPLVLKSRSVGLYAPLRYFDGVQTEVCLSWFAIGHIGIASPPIKGELKCPIKKILIK